MVLKRNINGKEIKVGDTVWYTNLGDKDGKYPPEQQPAMITRFREGTKICAWIFYPTGWFMMDNIPFSTSINTRGHWTFRE